MTAPAAQQFAYCPRCARRSSGSQAAGPFHCAFCGFVLYFSPAGAVAALLEDHDGRVLFTRRAKEPAAGRLGLPGGFVDPGETAEDALRREVREEIGVELSTLTYLASFPNRYTYVGVDYATVDLFFTARASDVSEARPLDAVASLEWHHPALVAPDELAFESMRRAVKLLADLRTTKPHP